MDTLLLAIGLTVVMLTMAGLLGDMERKRRALADLLVRLEPMADHSRRLRLSSLRRLSESLFYAYQLMAALDLEIGYVEQEKGVETAEGGGRFSLRAFKRLSNLVSRVEALEGLEGAGKEAAAGETPRAAEPADSAAGQEDTDTSEGTPDKAEESSQAGG